MEISEDATTKDKKKELIFQNMITYIGYSLFLLIILYMLYLIGAYVLFTPIYTVVKIFLYITNFYSSKIKNYFIILSITITIFLHILLIKIIITSVIFLSGGLFARMNFYNSFKGFIYQQIENISKILEILFFSLTEESKKELTILFSKIQSFQNAYNILKMQNNTSFEIKQFPFGEYLNNIIYHYNKYKDDNYESIKIKTDLTQNLKLCKNNLKPYSSFSLLDIFTKFNYYKSLQLFEEMLYHSFGKRKCSKINIYKDFNIYIISPELKNPEIKTLVVFCFQNACNVESFCFSHKNINFYLNIKDITILLWNYKGFGLRKGFPSFNSIDNDILILKDFISNYYPGYKIIIHGISIGGYPAILLAKFFNDNKNVCLVADRTYSDIDYIANTFIKKGKQIYNLLFPKFLYFSDNIQNYIDVPIGNKIIMFDENDKIINYSQSSLIYFLTMKYYKEIIIPKISNNLKYIKLKKLFSEENRDLNVEIQKIKRYNSVKLEENEAIFINHLNKNFEKLEHFFMLFLVFGYPFNKYNEINYEKKIFAENYICLPEKMKKK